MAAERVRRDEPEGNPDKPVEPDQGEVAVADSEAQLARREELLLEREKAVARRERAADEREARLNALERRLEDLARPAGLAVITIEERTREAIQRGQAMLATSAARLTRIEAMLSRNIALRDGGGREEVIPRETTVLVRARNHRAPPPASNSGTPTARERLGALRHQLADTARKLADAEEEAAKVYDTLATRRPGRARQSRHNAEQARAVAQRAREIADSFTPSAE